jgi:hypothetical protein
MTFEISDFKTQLSGGNDYTKLLRDGAQSRAGHIAILEHQPDIVVSRSHHVIAHGPFGAIDIALDDRLADCGVFRQGASLLIVVGMDDAPRAGIIEALTLDQLA